MLKTPNSSSKPVCKVIVFKSYSIGFCPLTLCLNEILSYRLQIARTTSFINTLT